MRQYTLVFMEQRIGSPRLTRIAGEAGVTVFSAEDEESAVSHISEHLIDRIKGCVRAELSSMRIVPDAAANDGIRFMDDSHSNPQFQDVFVRFDVASGTVAVEFESTRTALLLDIPSLRPKISRSGIA